MILVKPFAAVSSRAQLSSRHGIAYHSLPLFPSSRGITPPSYTQLSSVRGIASSLPQGSKRHHISKSNQKKPSNDPRPINTNPTRPKQESHKERNREPSQTAVKRCHHHHHIRPLISLLCSQILLFLLVFFHSRDKISSYGTFQRIFLNPLLYFDFYIIQFLISLVFSSLSMIKQILLLGVSDHSREYHGQNCLGGQIQDRFRLGFFD